MALDLTFINAALTRTGSPTVTELNDGTPGGNIAGQNYDIIVNEVLGGYPWRFATKSQALVNITGDPDPPWLYAYQLPTDLKHLRVVTVEGMPIEYEQQTDKVLCDVDPDYDVIAKYIWAVPELKWPPEFGEYITQRLEVLFLRGIGERYAAARDRAEDAEKQHRLAKTTDAKRASTRNPVRSPTLEARRGTVAAERLPWR